MSNITSGSSSGAPTIEQSKQQQALEQSQAAQPSEENQQRFAQKLQGEKQADNKKKAQKNEEQSKEAKALKDSQKKEQAELKEKSSLASTEKNAGLKEQKGKDSQGKADAILKNLGSAGQADSSLASAGQAASTLISSRQADSSLATSGTATQATANTPAQGTDRLFNEFQSVANRVMLTEKNLQQGGSIRLQLSEGVLPGTAVTFSMVGGALRATFSGNNKASLEKILKHRDKMTEHVQASSGVRIVVEAKEDDGQTDAQ